MKYILQFKFICVYFTLFLSVPLYGQKDTLHITSLDSIEIHAYSAKKILNHTASLNYVSASDMNRYAGLNMLPALNATPGVSMEERSPGSYRLNIRGSSVRSPYGVRNVKIYYNQIPFTAPGGASMLNMLALSQVGSVEVIKGPAGSMYGAGSGGVVLLNPRRDSAHSIEIKAGSEGMLGIQAAIRIKQHSIQLEQVKYKGYRQHTEMNRKSAFWNGTWKSGMRSHTEATLLFTDLFYETPGALTFAEYQQNPLAARPASPVFPGAEAAKASISQQSFLLGLTHKTKFSAAWNNISSVYAFLNHTKNPTVQNYEKKREPHFGLRSVFDYEFSMGDFLFTLHQGIEMQQGIFNYRTYTNDAGRADSLFNREALKIQQGMLFAQLDAYYKNWIFNLGASFNVVHMDMNRTQGQWLGHAKKNLQTIAPRVAIGYKTGRNTSVYLNLSDGFSPPAADEVFADNHINNLELKAETSRNIELGTRGHFMKGWMDFDLSFFESRIQNGIVTRRDAGGGNYFVNAGKMKQQGFEGQIGYEIPMKPNRFLSRLKLRTAFSFYDFIYQSFEQSGEVFTGNKMPGVAPQNFSFLTDFYFKKSMSLHFTYAYTAPIFLNDANSSRAEKYSLLSLKWKYEIGLSKNSLQVFAGVDNLTDQQYSLGNDINGFGGRFYNLAPGRSFYAGLQWKIQRK